MKADLHIHSNYSYDAISKPATILEMAAERKIDFIAITDHDTTAGWQEFARLSDQYPVHVVMGQEIKLYSGKYVDGEILALFLEKPIISKKISDILAEVKAQGGIVSLAHPFCDRRGEFRAFDQITDWSQLAIETKNGRIYKDRNNEMAENLANNLKMPKTAGSDAHTPFEIGNVYVEFDGTSPDDLKQAILNRDVQVRGESSHTFFSLASHFGRLGLAV